MISLLERALDRATELILKKPHQVEKHTLTIDAPAAHPAEPIDVKSLIGDRADERAADTSMERASASL